MIDLKINTNQGVVNEFSVSLNAVPELQEIDYINDASQIARILYSTLPTGTLDEFFKGIGVSDFQFYEYCSKQEWYNE